MKKFLGFLLGLLGFAGCESETETIRGGQMYGCRIVDYKLDVKGSVTDDQYNALENVEVKSYYPNTDSVWNSEITDKKGLYELPPTSIYLSDTLQVKFIATDLYNDYQNDTAIVTLVETDISYNQIEKTVNFTLKKKDGK